MENKGLIIASPGNLKLMNLALPRPNNDEILVRVNFTALCGSDIKLYLGHYTAPHKYPILIGHEWVGEVVQAGHGQSGFWQPGEIVTGDCSIFCGICSYCSTNKNHCLNVEKKGITVDGSCAQYICVKASHIYRCPPLPDSKVFALTEPLAVVVQAIINRIPSDDLHKVRNALIIGSGGIGSMALLALQEFDIPKITIVDQSPEKLAVLSSFGFSNLITQQTELSESSTLSGPFDLIIEASGSPVALQRAIDLASPCGRIVCVGHQKTLELDFGTVIKKSLTLLASIGSTGGFEKAIEIIRVHPEQVSKLITRIVPIDESPEYFATSLLKSADIKVLIDLR